MWAFGRRSGWCGSPDGGLHPARLRSRIRAAGRRGSEFGIGPGGGGGAVIPLVSPGRFPFRRFPIGTSRGLGAFVEWKPEMGWRILHPLGVEPGVIGRFQLARSDRFWGISSPMPWAVFRGIGPSPSPLLSSPLLSSPLRSRQMRSEFILEPERSHSVRSPPGEQIRFDLPGGTGRAG